ncbi:MAG: alcohol dehydrogenase catalytic domain-containing protein [Acidobacteriia bacterium]|nr:alcohol dehydrogenase catalytic domain-containing protein [Terriglobia bacterium]
MLAVRIDSGKLETVEIPPPERPEGFALLRLLCGGICNTDLELERGYYNFSGIPGHEFVAEVLESDSPALSGKRVVGEINLACHHCEWCRRELGRHCPTRTVLGIVNQPGAFEEFFVLPDRNLHVVPDNIPTERAVFTEPLAAACEILDQVNIPCNTPVAVLGDGKLGLLVAQVLNANGYPVHLFGRHKNKLRIAAAAGIGTELADGSLPMAAYEFVVDATGNQEGLRKAVAMARPRGTVIMKSTVHGMVGVDAAPIIVNELTLVGSRCGRFEAALPLLDHELIRVEELIEGQYKLADAAEAFEHAARPGTLKVLLYP